MTISAAAHMIPALPSSINSVKTTANTKKHGIPLLYPPAEKNIMGNRSINTNVTVIM